MSIYVIKPFSELAVGEAFSFLAAPDELPFVKSAPQTYLDGTIPRRIRPTLRVCVAAD